MIYREGIGQQHAADGALVEHTPEWKIEIPPSIDASIASERDAEVQRLTEQAKELAAMSTLDYLRRGITVRKLKSFELAGRLAKKGWDSLEYIDGKPGWRVYGRSSEWYVRKKTSSTCSTVRIDEQQSPAQGPTP